MIIDIRDDVPDFLKYIRRRVAEQVTASKKTRRPKPVSQIDFGFDTRPDAEPDGQWTVQIGKVKALKRPKWPIWHELPDDEVVYFIDLQAEKVNVMKSPDKKICKIVGEAMKHALLTARDAGVFKRLPKTENCQMGVENLEWYYGWPIYKDRGKENLV
jgi:hypothetical protein